MSGTRKLTPDQVADRCQKVLNDVPADELAEASIEVIVTLCGHGLYAEAAALWRRSGMSEDRVMEAVMVMADRLDRDQDIALELVYGGW